MSSSELVAELKANYAEHVSYLERRDTERKAAGWKGVLFDRLTRREKKKQNSNVVVTGEPGFGKSALTLVMGEDLRPDWFVDKPVEAVERFVTFTGADFGRAVKTQADQSVLIGDEWGQQMQHRRFMSEPNVQLSNVLQGYRFHRFKAFLNLPGLRYLDPDAEGLVNYQVHFRDQGVAEVFKVLHPKFGGGTFHKTELDTLRFRLPRKELWDAYMEKKIKNQSLVVDRAIKAMDKGETVELTPHEIAAIVKERPEDYSKGGEIYVTDLQADFGISINRAYVVKRLVEGKREKAAPRPVSDDSAKDLLRRLGRA